MTIFELLYKLKDLLIKSSQTKISDKEILILSNNKNYFRINNSSIILFDLNILNKLYRNDSSLDWNKFHEFLKFIKAINNNIVKLNHLGFGYRVSDINEELKKYQRLLPDGFHIFEERSDDLANNRWFFVKHNTNKLIPKIELIFYQTDKYKDYYPQFQIDIDTDLSYDVLKDYANKYLGKDFFFWNFDIPNYGIVMGMGKIGIINGINILVGLGTNLRKNPQLNKVNNNFPS